MPHLHILFSLRSWRYTHLKQVLYHICLSTMLVTRPECFEIFLTFFLSSIRYLLYLRLLLFLFIAIFVLPGSVRSVEWLAFYTYVSFLDHLWQLGFRAGVWVIHVPCSTELRSPRTRVWRTPGYHTNTILRSASSRSSAQNTQMLEQASSTPL